MNYGYFFILELCLVGSFLLSSSGRCCIGLCIEIMWDAIKGRSDIVVYSFPYSGSAEPTADLLISKRDSVLRKNVPGAFPGSYMTTAKCFPPVYERYANSMKNCCVLRGLWDMEGDKMGGPFVSYIYHDRANSRILVAEGFVFAPESKKANLIRQLEASLLTVSFKE